MSAMSHASFDAGVLLGYAVENGDQWRCFCGDMHMQKLKDMDGRQGELPALVEGQQWKLWLARAILAAACASFLMPGCIGRMLDVPGVAVQLGQWCSALLALSGQLMQFAAGIADFES